MTPSNAGRAVRLAAKGVPSAHTLTRSVAFSVASHIHTSPNATYTPPYLTDSRTTSIMSYTPTVVTFPATPNGQTLAATYVCFSSNMTTASEVGQLSPQHILPPQRQSLADDSFKFPATLGTYRFPARFVVPRDFLQIREGIEKDDSNIVHLSSTPHYPTGGISDMEKPFISEPTVDAKALFATTRQPVGQIGDKVPAKVARNVRGHKYSGVPDSVLLTRRISSCIQPCQSKSPITAGSPGKRSKRSKAKHCCKLCNQSFTRAHDLKRHNTTHESYKAYPCPYCSKAFGRKDALTRHIAVRGTNHNDYTKKAAAKQKCGLDGLPKASRKLATISEESDDQSTDMTMVTAMATVAPLDSVILAHGHVTDPSHSKSELTGSSFIAPDIGTERTPRASSIHEQICGNAYSDGLAVPQPFNIDRKSSLVQGLPSAHLHLDEADLLHAFINPFAANGGF